jgi:bacterioferritin-associated ferredoxin
MTTMIVCSCRAVSDRTIGAAMAAGATCVDSITAKCGAGGRCGGCWPELERLLADHASRHETAATHAA